MPAATLAKIMRKDRGLLLAALIARGGDFQRAEDALHEAAASALVHWARTGVPSRPQGWLLRAGLRKLIDGYRRDRTAERKRAALEPLALEEASDPDPDVIADDRLRLIFTCCHPALEEKTRIALTLRSLCGLTTAQVAAVFLDAEPTMGQRLSRARAKIVAARIPFALPGPEDLADRLHSVLTTVYLIFTSGYAQGPETGIDLCTEAIFLARLLAQLAPDEPEVEAALALLLLTHARAGGRIGPDGQTLPPARQDRSRWDLGERDEGCALLDQALARQRPGSFQIKAAIAALHSADGPPDWPQIAALYGRLLAFEPTPVIALNHAVALAEAGHPRWALAQVSALAGDLDAYQRFHAVLADLLSRTGEAEAARAAYVRAIALATSAADRAFLQSRLSALG